MPNKYDFYSPFVSAALITKKGDRVPLWTNVLPSGTPETLSASSTTRNNLTSFPFLESLSVELSISYLPRLSATLTPPFQDARKFVDSPLVEWGQTILEAIVGYSAGTPNGPVLSIPFQGLILKPDIGLGVDTTVVLNAQGVAGYDATVTQASRAHRDVTRKQILTLTAQGVGKPARGLSIDDSEIDSGSDADTLLSQKVNMEQGWKTDWMFMTQVAKDCGCWLSLGTKSNSDGSIVNVVTLLPISATLGDRPKYTLRYYDFVGGAFGPGHTNFVKPASGIGPDDMVRGDFPILAMNSPTQSVWLPGSTKALVSQGIDSSTGKVINKVYNEKNSGAPENVGAGGKGITGNANQPGVDPDTGSGGAPTGLDVNFAESDTTAKETFKADFNMGVVLKVTTLGIPTIVPGDVVAVRGVGQRFDWNYGVFVVRHNIGSSGFTTELELRSNTAAILSSVIQAQGQLNTESPQAAGTQVSPTAQPALAGS